MFLRNHWYAAGFSDELGQALLARRFLGDDVVMYRKGDGTPVALENRCAHRRVPLSLGRLVGDTLQCGYHGLEYDCSGKCTHIPGQRRIPASARVRAYPIVDRHRYLWIWMGEPARADARSIPDYGFLDRADIGLTKIALRNGAHVQLIIDNLMDLSHLAYVHATTTGSPAIAETAKVATARDGDTVRVKRWMENVPAPPTFRQFGRFKGNIDSWQVSRFDPPTYVRVSYGSADAGTGVPAGEWFGNQGQWGFMVFHGLTPETETTTHQFRHVAHPLGGGSARTSREFYRQCDQIITEDYELFPVQQRAIDADPGADANRIGSRVSIVHDSGLLMCRQIVDRLRRAEAAKARRRTQPAARRPAAAR